MMEEEGQTANKIENHDTNTVIKNFGHCVQIWLHSVVGAVKTTKYKKRKSYNVACKRSN